MDVKNKGLFPGTILHGAYRIERILGQGGFGITYLAYEIRLDRHVAIKEFFPKDYCDRESTTSQVTLGTGNTKELVDTLKAKFLREAKYIAKLDHPGIIKIHTAFEENQTAYYVMDFIEGSNLSQLVKKRLEQGEGPLPEKEAVRYIRMTGEALDYLHRHTMNHFDVKPANILVRESDNRPILIDFGLSKQYGDTAQKSTTTIMGMSQGYAPMEQYVAGGVKEFSPQTDIYALAATLYYLLSGVVPPDAPSLAEQELIFPSKIPVRLIKPISKAMSFGRADRHASVGRFLEELKDSDLSVNPQVTTLGPEAGSKSGTKGSRRYTWVWIAAGICVGLTVWLFVASRSKLGDGAVKPGVTELSSGIHENVEDFEWESPLGRSLYAGPVLTDPSTGEKIPDGKGVAKIIDGVYEGCVYDGEFKRGVLDGETVYTYKNGDTFEGTFINNAYSKGRYTIKESGEYFEGTYRDGDPDKGNWYDKNGNEIE